MEASGASVKLVYSETLDADSVPPIHAFAVVLNPGYRSAELAGVAVRGSEVALTLAQAATGDTLGLTYEVPDTGAIRDADRLEAVGLTWATAAIEVTPPPPHPPPPDAPVMSEALATSVTVSWIVPDNDGPPITSYDLRYRQGTTGQFTDGPQDVTETSAIIEGLDPDTQYEVQVRSNSTAGDSRWITLGSDRTNVLVLYDRFCLSLDLDSTEKDQYVSSFAVSPGGAVPIQVFGSDFRNARGLTLRVGYDLTQVVLSGFDVAEALPRAHALVKQDSTFVEIGIASQGGRATIDSGLVGTIRFRTTDAFSETEIRLAGADLVRDGPLEAMARSVIVALQAAAPPSPDFDGNGLVAFADFVVFAGVFGYGEGDEKYEAKYDLNGDGGVGFDDFVVFARSFGNAINRPPVFPSTSPVMREVGRGRTFWRAGRGSRQPCGEHHDHGNCRCLPSPGSLKVNDSAPPERLAEGSNKHNQGFSVGGVGDMNVRKLIKEEKLAFLKAIQEDIYPRARLRDIPSWRAEHNGVVGYGFTRECAESDCRSQS